MSILHEYFKIIRTARDQNRKKGIGVYYEAHHVVPESFEPYGKKSSLVLLTAQEHYECHRLLAEAFKHHPVYSKKMLWAFHRMAYSKKRKLTADEYAEARELLMTLWTRKQTDEHKKKIANAQIGNTNNKSRVFKGMKSDISEEGRRKLAAIRKKELTGKVGDQAKASKGWVICEYENGQFVEAGSALQLANLTGIPQSTISCRLNRTPGVMKKGYKIYYK
jgi:hypothetical protein